MSFSTTVSVTVVVCVCPPPVPVTVMVKVPVVAVGDATNVRVDDPVPPETSVTVDGLNVAVVPLGGAELDSVIVPLKPFSDVKVIVVVALDP